jgi:hypothetical protein
MHYANALRQIYVLAILAAAIVINYTIYSFQSSFEFRLTLESLFVCLQ